MAQVGLSSPTSPMRGVHLIQAAYLVFILVFLLYVGIGLTPDVLFLLLAFAFALRGSRRAFVRDFAPFILLLLSYDAMRGIADDLGGRVHIPYPIDADRALFSEVQRSSSSAGSTTPASATG